MAERTTGVVDNGQTEGQQHHSADHYKVCREWTHLGITILTFFVLIYYAHQTRIQAAANKRAAKATAKAAAAAMKQVEVAREANRQTREAMEIDKRPWVTEVGIKVFKPLTFEENGEVTIGIRVPVRNFGNSVAVKVRVDADIMLTDSKHPLTEIEERRKGLCEPLRRGKGGRPSFEIPLLFPKQDLSDPFQIPAQQEPTGQVGIPEDFPGFTLRIQKKEIEERKFPVPDSQKMAIFPIVYGCIDYRATFSSTHYGIGFIYYVLRNIPNDQTRQHFYIGEDVPLSDMLLRRDPVMESYIYEDKEESDTK